MRKPEHSRRLPHHALLKGSKLGLQPLQRLRLPVAAMRRSGTRDAAPRRHEPHLLMPLS